MEPPRQEALAAGEEAAVRPPWFSARGAMKPLIYIWRNAAILGAALDPWDWCIHRHRRWRILIGIPWHILSQRCDTCEAWLVFSKARLHFSTKLSESVLAGAQESLLFINQGGFRWGFPQMEVPPNGWFVRENANKMNDLDWFGGYHYFRNPPRSPMFPFHVLFFLWTSIPGMEDDPQRLRQFFFWLAPTNSGLRWYPIDVYIHV